MGKEQSKIDLYKDFAEAGLIQPWSQQYENDFEKQVIMAINLFRHEPSKWVAAFQEAFREAPELKKIRAPSQKALIDYIQGKQRSAPVSFDDQANEACRQNNKEVIAKAEKEPTTGGNLAKYSATAADGKAIDVSREYTFVRYTDP